MVRSDYSTMLHMGTAIPTSEMPSRKLSGRCSLWYLFHIVEKLKLG